MSAIGSGSKATRAFTLVELLIYLSLLSVMLLGLSYFLIAVKASRAKSIAIAEVADNGRQVLMILTNVFNQAEAIDWSVSELGVHPGKLGLIRAGQTQLIYINEQGALLLDSGSSQIKLTSNTVRVNNFVIEKFADNAVGIKVTISYWPQGSSSAYNYEASWQSAYELPY